MIAPDGSESRPKYLEVRVQAKEYGGYPYLDTLKFYTPYNGILSSGDGEYQLEDTGGGYSEIEGGVWSDWYDRRINDDDAVYSDPLGDHLIRDSAVEVVRGYSRRRGWYPDDYDDIFFDEDHDEYFHVDDGVYSEVEDRMLWSIYV